MVILKLFLPTMQVNCDKCDAWAHFKCAGFRPAVETSFYCIKCKKCKKDFVK